MPLTKTSKERRAVDGAEAFDDLLILVGQWQEDGRSGFSLPVLRGDLLERLEKLADQRRRETCTCCGGYGRITDGYDRWDCAACAPLSPETEA